MYNLFTLSSIHLSYLYINFSSVPAQLLIHFIHLMQKKDPFLSIFDTHIRACHQGAPLGLLPTFSLPLSILTITHKPWIGRRAQVSTSGRSHAIIQLVCSNCNTIYDGFPALTENKADVGLAWEEAVRYRQELAVANWYRVGM